MKRPYYPHLTKNLQTHATSTIDDCWFVGCRNQTLVLSSMSPPPPCLPPPPPCPPPPSPLPPMTTTATPPPFKIVTGAGAFGCKLKDALTTHLKSLNIKVIDLGVSSYYSIAYEVCRRVSADPTMTLGLVACGTSVGVTDFTPTYSNTLNSPRASSYKSSQSSSSSQRVEIVKSAQELGDGGEPMTQIAMRTNFW